MVKLIPTGSKVAMIGGLAADPGSLAREKGFSDAVAGKLNVIQTVASNADRLKAQQDSAQIIRANPDIKGFFTVSGDMSLGIQAAVAQAGKQGSIMVIGVDGTVPQLQQVQQGLQPAAVEQFPYLMGWQGIEACLASMHGKQVPATVPTPALLVTQGLAAEAIASTPAPPASFNYSDPLAALV
jgi:ABC-type sugar transport system substrate-binding protein